MVISYLKTTVTSTPDHVRTFFDQCGRDYGEQHGDPDRLISYRIGLIKKWTQLKPGDVLLDIGCGNGHHLLALEGSFRSGIGIDFSKTMIEVAKERLKGLNPEGKISFCVDDGQKLSTIQDESIDVAMCIGSLEHMFDQASALTNAFRVLKPNGRFLCLTPNGNHVWYRFVAPVLRIDTLHFSSDTFVTEKRFRHMLISAGFETIEIGYWGFVPKRDMHPAVGLGLDAVGILGRFFGIRPFQGGLVGFARKS